jgi:predicted transcriptional regulator
MSSGHLVPLPPPDGRGQQLGEVAHVLYQVNHMLPDDQTMVTVSPDTIARDALRLMKQHGYSQLPVMQQGAVVGVFSHRSFCRGGIGPRW